jgi:hypothetical protein
MKKLAIIFCIFSQVNAQFTPELTYTDINGEEINPSEILSQGKYLYLDFFSTTCGACNNVAEEVVNAFEVYGSNTSSVFFLGVEYGSTSIACNNFSELHNSTFPIIAGQEGGIDIFSLFNQTGYPSGKLISPSGEIEANFTYSDIINLTESLAPHLEENTLTNCDFIDLISIELHSEVNNALLLNVFSETPGQISYPSFFLLNPNGDTLAYESVNYFGLDSQSSHILEIVSNPADWTDDLTLILFSEFEDNIECSFNITIDQINLSGCTDTSAYNYDIYAQSGNESCIYQSCNELYFDVLTSEIQLTNQGNGLFTLEIPIINNYYYYLAYPMSELQILNDDSNDLSCINCDFNVMNNPWNALDTNYYNLNIMSTNLSDYNYEAKLYLENFENNGQNFSGCVFDESIFFNLSPIIVGCTDPEAVNYDSIANQSNNTCLYTSNNYSQIYINLNSGWNMVGFSCFNQINVSTAMTPYIDKLIILKDNLGNAFLPEWDFNGVGEFERGYGYQLKLTEGINDFNLCNE